MIRLIVPALILAIIIGYLSYSFYVAKSVTSLTSQPVDYSPLHVSSTYEDVSFQAADGVPLKGWFFKAPSKKLIIFISGVKSNRTDEGAYGIGLARDALARDYNILMYDTRNDGQSGKATVTFGEREGYDIDGALAFAHDKGFDDAHIALVAFSMGTASVLLHLDRFQSVGAIVLDSPFARLKPVMSRLFWTENHILPIMHPGIFFFTKLVYGVDVAKINPIDGLAKAPNYPLLLFHGEQDQTIPVSNSKELIAKASSASQLVLFPNTNHVGAYKGDPVKYREALFGYLANRIANQ